MTKTCLLLFVAGGILWGQAVPGSLRGALTFYAGFDSGLDADVSLGDKRIYSAPSYKEQGQARPGLGDVDVEVVRGEGIRGDALRFTKKNTRALFYEAAGNVAFREKDWSGTVSFWLRLNPEQDLDPGFCDPIQITDKAYNNSAIWVDFTKDEQPRHFRLGVFGDLAVWNPKKLPGDENPAFGERLVIEPNHPFSRERWTHVAITWLNLNGREGQASLYLDGRLIGTAEGIDEPFVWDPSKAAIRLGVNYIGLFDELALFDRALTAAEVGELNRLLR